MTIEDYLKSKGKETNRETNSYRKNLIMRTLLTTTIVLALLVICNLSDKAKNYLNKYIFETNYNFAKINSLYKKYFLDLKPKLPLKNNDTTLPVSKTDNLSTLEIKDYLEGAEITVGANYEVKMLDSGLIVFIGEKEGYGSVVVVQQSNGIDVTYGNITPGEIKIYDYIEKGKTLGTADDKLYLLFTKDGESLDYKTYIK